MFDDEEDFYKREKESEGRYYSIKVKIRAIFILLIIFGISFFLFQSFGKTKNLKNYSFAYEQDGKLYSLNLSSWHYSMDRFSKNPHLYINTFDFDGESYIKCFAGDFLSFVYNDFEISESQNPYFSGSLSLNASKYCTTEKVYKNAKNSYEKSIFLDNSGEEIYTYDPMAANKYIKNIAISGKRSSSKINLRMLSMNERYVDLTKLLEEQGIKFQMKIDNKKKIIIISIQNSNKKTNDVDQEKKEDLEVKEEPKIEEIKPEQEVEPESEPKLEDIKETEPEKTEVPSEDTGIKRDRTKKTRIY
ncbi:MAG: hypothetical protein KBF12_01025 [Sebaldella sp.]|nr:hypothetical protein [Sebaldella sp.]